MKRQSIVVMTLGAFVGLLLLGASWQSALAAVTFDSETGEGFVGKGDVQQVFGWNNKQLQENADAIQFRLNSSEETTWTCYNSHNEKEQNRQNTSTIEGVVTAVERTRNQVTGFILEGYDGDVTQETTGQNLLSCPSGADWSLVEDSVQTTQTGGGLQVSNDGENWYDLA